jgi:hypothetical protein
MLAEIVVPSFFQEGLQRLSMSSFALSGTSKLDTKLSDDHKEIAVGCIANLNLPLHFQGPDMGVRFPDRRLKKSKEKQKNLEL